MTGLPLIDAHLAALEERLDLPRRVRSRALAEAADHLLCATEERCRAGEPPADAQRAAIRDYGPAELVARRHAEALAMHATRRLPSGLAAAVASFCALFAAATQFPSLRAGAAIADGASGAVGWLAVQVALTCGALTIARCLRHRHDAALATGKLRWIARGAAATLAAIAVALVTAGAALLLSPSAAAGRGQALVLVLLGLAGAATILAGWQTAAAFARIGAQARHADEPALDDALDDIGALSAAAVRAVGRVPVLRCYLEVAKTAARSPLVTAAGRWADLRRHPWRFGVATALLAGLAISSAHLIGEEPPANGIMIAFAVTGIIVAIEAAAVLGCFALLGGFLGIRNPQRAG